MDNLARAGEKQKPKRKKGEQETRFGKADLNWVEKVREKIAHSEIANRLIKHINGDVRMSPEQVSAARILLDKVIPNLQAVENTVINEYEGLNPEDVQRQVIATLSANPALLIDILRLMAQDQVGRSVVQQALSAISQELKPAQSFKTVEQDTPKETITH